MRYCCATLVASFAALLIARQEPAPQTAAVREPRATTVNSVFNVQTHLEPAIRSAVAKARQVLAGHREQGQFIAYISTPMSPRGGGHAATNLAISSYVKAQLETRFGPRLWAFDPGQFSPLQGAMPEPQGSDYLFMWSEILAGKEGLAEDFDMVYFVGPGDARSYFDSQGVVVQANSLGEMDRYITQRAAKDERFRQDVAAKPETRQGFLRYYGLRASASFSQGAHDEWNLFVRINRKRAITDQIAMYFDGRPLSPAEMDTEIRRGYEVR